MGSNAYDRLIEGTFKYAIDTDESVSSIISCAFYNASLWIASFPTVTQIGKSAFVGSGLRIANFPNVTSLSGTFERCVRLSITNFPNVQTIYTSTFSQCGSLAQISLPSLNYIGGAAFYSCVGLVSLYLLGSQFCSVENGSVAFRNTPFDNPYGPVGGWGSIYIPASLWNQYWNDTGWSWVRNRFVSVNME